jgi:RTX calcium-binding nonapeptide repeat (4 copies)
LGGDGIDMLIGEAGDELLDGGKGADSLVGGTGDDTLDGGGGADTIRGSDGEDLLSGASGADVFAYTTELTNGIAEGDMIVDYSAAQGDKIDLADGVSVAGSVVVNGNLVISLTGDGDTIELVGIHNIADVVLRVTARTAACVCRVCARQGLRSLCVMPRRRSSHEEAADPNGNVSSAQGASGWLRSSVLEHLLARFRRLRICVSDRVGRTAFPHVIWNTVV